MFKDKVVIITGGAQGIGRCMAERFAAEGARVWVVDIKPAPAETAGITHVVGNLAEKAVLEALAERLRREAGRVDVLVNNALPLMKGLDACSYEEFSYALAVGVTAPFYLAKLLAPLMPAGSSIVNISSSRDRMSQAQTESYTAAKGGIAALTHALANSLAGRVRVNSVSPGWIETQGRTWAGADAAQQPAGRVGTPADIAETVMFLCSPKAGFITSENICVDGGMTRRMIYHGDEGWQYTQP
ncbi:MAG: SDR family oxidoreductase [Akkermansia sp.]|nr:SDR family oxidoreductase [Akkermansia sp.]